MLFRKAINKCCTKQTIYLIDKCYNYSIKTQSRCSYSCADSQVGRHKSHTKFAFFFEKNVVGHTIFAGRPAKSARHIVYTSFILGLPYLAHISSLCLS